MCSEPRCMGHSESRYMSQCLLCMRQWSLDAWGDVLCVSLHVPMCSESRCMGPMCSESRCMGQCALSVGAWANVLWADAPRLRAKGPMHRDSAHIGPCTEPAHTPRLRVAHAPRRRAHRPMHQDTKHIGPCTEPQTPLAHAQRPPAHEPRLRAQGPMHRGSEHIGPCT